MAGPQLTRPLFAWLSVTRNTAGVSGSAVLIVITTLRASRKKDRSALPGRSYTFPAPTTPAQTVTTVGELLAVTSISKIAAAVIRDSRLELEIESC
jgi:hypothetical protein